MYCYDTLSYQSTKPQSGWIYNSNKLSGSIVHTSLLSPFGYYVSSHGYMQGGSLSSDNNGVRPVVYLSSSVKIIEGTGEQNNPCKLGL